MALTKFVTFVVLKIVDNLVFMQNSLSILSEFWIHFTELSIVLAENNVGIFT